MAKLTKSNVENVWIVNKTTDLIFCEEDGGYYYFQQYNYPLEDKFSRRFPTMQTASIELATGKIEWEI